MGILQYRFHQEGEGNKSVSMYDVSNWNKGSDEIAEGDLVCRNLS